MSTSSTIPRHSKKGEEFSSSEEKFSVPSSNVLDLKRLVEEKKRASSPPSRPTRRSSFWWASLFRLKRKVHPPSQRPVQLKSQSKHQPATLPPVVPKILVKPPGPLHGQAPAAQKPKTTEPEFFVFAEEPSRRSLEAWRHALIRVIKKPFTRVRPQHPQKEKPMEPEQHPEQAPPLTRVVTGHKSRPFAVSVGFAGIGLLLILPLFAFANFQKAKRVEERVLGVSDQALASLKSAGTFAAAAKWDQADSAFDQAIDQFSEAQAALLSFDGLLRSLAPALPTQGKKFQSAEHLLEGGKAIAQAGAYLGQALKPFQEFDLELIKTEDLEQPYGFTTILLLSNAQLRPAEQELAVATTHFLKVDPKIIPEDKREQFITLQQYLPALQSSVKELINVSDQLLTFLGHDENRRYLFLFQNDHELRATGGFISSFALLDIAQGQITKLEVPGGGTYDLKGWLTEQVLAPEPLRLVNPHWNAQDANWWPDFPTSAEKFIWFYEHSGGPSVDGVIAITPTVIEEFLKQTGPIDMTDNYGAVIDAEHFRAFAEAQSAAQRDVEGGTPKQFIADFAPRFLNTVFSTRQENLLLMLQTFYRFLREKHILFYLSEPDEQAAFTKFGWTGTVLSAPQDYLSVVNTNIAGGPTDGLIDQVITHEATIQPDGSIDVNVTLERIHRGDPTQTAEGAKNIDYVRFYVPEGSVLKSASGFEQPGRGYFLNPEQGYGNDEDYSQIEGRGQIHAPTGVRIAQAFGKTVFGHWVQTESGTATTVTISYRLPFRLSIGGLWNRSDRYSALFQKQAGAKAASITSVVHLPPSFAPSYLQPADGFTQEANELRFHAALNEDRLFGMVVSND